MNKNLKTLVLAGALGLIITLMCFAIPVEASYIQDFNFVDGQNCYNITDDVTGYEYYDACFYEDEFGDVGGGEGSYAHFNNKSLRYENLYAIVTPDEQAHSPKTWFELSLSAFIGMFHI